MVIAELKAGEAPPSVVIEIVRRLERGQVLLLPTDTVYGLHALSSHAGAVERIRRIKGLPPDRPLSNLFSTVVGLGRFVQLPEGSFRRKVLEGWPGPVTWVLPAQPGVPNHLIGQERTLGIRIPDNQLLRSVSAALDSLIISTSANRHGNPAPARREDIDPEILSEVDGTVFQIGPLPGRPSEVKRWTPAGPEVLRTREGATLNGKEGLNILIVCSGNICRSPMGEGFFRDYLQKEAQGRFVVRSAGLTGQGGLRAVLPAVEVMREHGIDIAGHRSRLLDEDLVEWADVILAMTSDQLGELYDRFPDDSEKMFLFSAYPSMEIEGFIGVEDPVGQDTATYRRVANVIEHEMKRIVPHLMKLLR